MTQSVELSERKSMLQSLMKCPHGKLSETAPIFKKVLVADPLFAGKAFYALHLEKYNQIRDLEESANSFLLVSPFPEHRRAGRILFRNFEPYRAYRVGDFIATELKPNRQVRSAVEEYLRELERNTGRFDGAVRVARKELHRLYETYHIKPSKRAQTILFDKKTPEGEVSVSKLLVDAKTPEEQARIIIDYKVPYRLATSALKGLTPAVWVALIEVMTPHEALNLRQRIEKSGILQDERIRKLYQDKLAKTGKSKRVSYSTLGERASAKGEDKQLEEIVQKARQEKISEGQKITVDTAVYVDISGSMEAAIEIAKKFGPIIGPICEADLNVYAFNTVAHPIVVEDRGKVADWEKAFRLIRAGEWTSLGCAMEASIKTGKVPEQAVFITDQGENRRPFLTDVVRRHNLEDTKFIFLNCVAHGNRVYREVAKQLEGLGMDVMEYDFDTNLNRPGWYVDLNNVVPLLTKGGYAQLVTEIMELELPK